MVLTEKQQTIHRTANTILFVLTVVFGIFYVSQEAEPIYDDLTGVTQQRIERQEISQIMNDESLRTCKYKDSLGNTTIGVGHLVTNNDKFSQCITTHEVIELLIKDYGVAKESVDKRYPWAEGEVRLILINMTFQLGEGRLSKFTDTLAYLKAGDYIKASGEVLDSVMYKQAPKRIERHAARILSLVSI